MDEVDGADGDPEGAGHDCPAPQVLADIHQADPPSPGYGAARVEATAEEQATILAMLIKRAAMTGNDG